MGEKTKPQLEFLRNPKKESFNYKYRLDALVRIHDNTEPYNPERKDRMLGGLYYPKLGKFLP